ncbi:hypothetical protein DFQ26_006416 [Actinomortierella ambigua]|nr:hypothetical protein DFQ26_006416 [Actinomortierella ambigua]
MTKKILVVFGATGNQGGSVIDTFLSDPHLTSRYHLRAVTRDASRPAAKALQAKGAEVVEGDVDDTASLARVLNGAHIVFLTTMSIYDEQLRQREERQVRAVVDAIATGGTSKTVRQIIFSSLPDATSISGGKYQVQAFDSKYGLEHNVIRPWAASHGIRTAFYAPGVFFQNLHGWLRPQPVETKTSTTTATTATTTTSTTTTTTKYAIRSPYLPTTAFPWTDASADTGKWVAAAVEEPEKYDGSVFCAATRVYTMEEVVQAVSRATGKTVVLETAPLPEATTHGALQAMTQFLNEFPYYGDDQEGKLRWAQEQARPFGALTTLEEYLARNPLVL